MPNDYPFGAKRIFYFSKAQFAKLTGNYNDYLFFNKQVVELYAANDKLLQYYFAPFLGDAVNLLDGLIEINDYDIFFEEHKRITELIHKNEKQAYCLDNSIIYVIQYYFPQIAYNNAKEFKQAIQFAEDYFTFLEKNRCKLSCQFLAKSSVEIALAYLYNQNFTQVITHLETAIDSEDYYSQYVGRILNILAHNALDNEFLLDSLFQSFFHYLKTVEKKEQIVNIRRLKKHVKNKTIHLLKNEDFEDFVYIHWDVFEGV